MILQQWDRRKRIFYLIVLDKVRFIVPKPTTLMEFIKLWII